MSFLVTQLWDFRHFFFNTEMTKTNYKEKLATRTKTIKVKNIKS